MTPPIPQEIVEAAARAAHAERRRLMPILHIWEDAGDLIKDEYRRVAIAVLEAAAQLAARGLAIAPAIVKVCHVCGDKTDLCCSDCGINFGATVYVCRKSACRDEHEHKCFGCKPIAPATDAGFAAGMRRAAEIARAYVYETLTHRELDSSDADNIAGTILAPFPSAPPATRDDPSLLEPLILTGPAVDRDQAYREGDGEPAPPASEGEIESVVRDALEFYADPENWKLNGRCDPNSAYFTGFTKARAAVAALSRAREAGSTGEPLPWESCYGAQELATDPTKILSAGTTTSPGTVGREGPAQTGADLRANEAQSELAAALRPFADEAERLDDAHAKMNVDDEWDALGAVIKMGDLRRARAVLAKLASGGGGNVSR